MNWNDRVLQPFILLLQSLHVPVHRRRFSSLRTPQPFPSLTLNLQPSAFNLLPLTFYQHWWALRDWVRFLRIAPRWLHYLTPPHQIICWSLRDDDLSNQVLIPSNTSALPKPHLKPATFNLLPTLVGPQGLGPLFCGSLRDGSTTFSHPIKSSVGRSATMICRTRFSSLRTPQPFSSLNLNLQPSAFYQHWWALRDSNPGPKDYESFHILFPPLSRYSRGHPRIGP